MVDKEYNKRWYKKNKELQKEHMRKYIICDICGLSIRKLNITNHKKTNKCKEIHELVKKIS